MAKKGQQITHFQRPHVYCQTFTRWNRVPSLLQEHSTPYRQAGLRVSRLSAKVPQTLPRESERHLPDVHHLQYRIIVHSEPLPGQEHEYAVRM